jgi:hypothetical protein
VLIAPLYGCHDTQVWIQNTWHDIDDLQITCQVLGIDRPWWEYLNLPADHGPVIREVDVISAQIEVVTDFVEGLAQYSLV